MSLPVRNPDKFPERRGVTRSDVEAMIAEGGGGGSGSGASIITITLPAMDTGETFAQFVWAAPAEGVVSDAFVTAAGAWSNRAVVLMDFAGTVQMGAIIGEQGMTTRTPVAMNQPVSTISVGPDAASTLTAVCQPVGEEVEDAFPGGVITFTFTPS